MQYQRTILFFLLLFFLGTCSIVVACQCPLSGLSMEECNKYEVIFKGKILSVTPCGSKFGEAMFDVEELYKGNTEQQFKVLFDCNEDCAYNFQVGEEWIIYSRYKQINNAKMDWCSRSRRLFKNDKEDYYTATYGNDYADEVEFLQENLGLHRVMVKKEISAMERNKLPDVKESIAILLFSLGGILLFYFLFKKYFK